MRRLTALLLMTTSMLSGGAFCEAAQTNFSARGKGAAPRPPIAQPLTTLQVGEKFVFDVYWMGFHVGYGSLELKERVAHGDREAFHVVAVAETNEVLSSLYPVRDEIHSYIDTQHFHSLEFRKTLSEGRYRADEHIVYDYERNVGLYESFKNGSSKEVPLPGLVHDFVSSFYWFRLQPAEVGRSIRTVINSEEKNWDLEIEVQKQEALEIRGKGTVETILIEPKTRLKGVLFARGRAWVHFSADARRVPVWMRIQTPFGPVSGVLRDLPEGLSSVPPASAARLD